MVNVRDIFQLVIVWSASSGRFSWSDNFSYINLPDSHLSQYFTTFPQEANRCLQYNDCIYKELLQSSPYGNTCWGYEKNCPKERRFSNPRCPGKNLRYVKDKTEQIETFYTQADFGYIRQQLREMSLMCEPTYPHDSSLECSQYLRFCRGRNLMFNFTDLATRSEPIRYKMDVLKQGQVAGYCKLQKERLTAELDHLSALQSWAPELRFFEELPARPLESGMCDVVVNEPTFIMKIDATSNMYHHFCDFFNLYASLHVNQSHPFAFRTDVNIIIWESYTYESAFASAFNAFTTNPIWDLKTFSGKSVCFKNVVLPLLPRMIFGLFYNTPVINGCEKSGLFQAFAEFMLHRLRIPLHPRKSNKVRITFLVRRTKYRQVLNEEDLYEEISNNSQYEVQKVAFGRGIPFTKQLEIVSNSDVLIGMHGAGLTHLMFLPNWAAVFELYNCEDPNCYMDLARLRGVKYITWEKAKKVYPQDEGHHPEGGAHAKFTNYSFDVKEFARLVREAADYVVEQKEFQQMVVEQSKDGTLNATRGHNEL